MIQARPFPPQEWLAVVLILLIAAWLRLDDPDAGEFQYDQADLTLLTLQLTKGDDLPTRGVTTSRGIFNTPAMVYVNAFFFLISDHPTSAMIGLRLWHLLGVALLYGLLRRVSGPQVAMAGTLSFACSPWAVLYSSFIWNVNLIFPFLVGSIWLLLEGLKHRRLWWQAWAFPLFSLVPQFHLGALSLIPLWGWLLATHWRGIRWAALPMGVALSLATLIPFFADMSRAELEEYRQFFFGDDMTQSQSRLTNQPFDHAINLTAGLDVEAHLVFNNDPAPLLEAVPRPDGVWLGLVGLALLGFLLTLLQNPKLAVIFFFWIGLPLLSTLDASRTAAHYHYLSMIIPPACWLIGIGVIGVGELRFPSRPHLGFQVYRGVVYSLFISLLLSQGLWWKSAYAYVNTHALSTGTPYRYLNPIREHLQAFDDIVIVGGGATTGTHLWKPLLYDTPCLRDLIASDSALAVFPARPFAVLYPPDAQINALDPLTRDLYIVGQGELFYLRQNETPYRVYVYPQAPTFPLPITPIPPQAFEGGATLMGYRLEPVMLYLEWQLGPPPDDESAYTYFAHFLDSAGERIGQRDAGFWPSRYWCVGDRVVQWTSINLPPATVALRIGLYQRSPDGGIVNRNVLDAQGNPSGQWAEITLP
jgi:hypothetical protein